MIHTLIICLNFISGGNSIVGPTQVSQGFSNLNLNNSRQFKANKYVCDGYLTLK